MICPDCGGDYKNLGVHKRFCESASQNLIIDEYLGKSLSFLLQSVREVLKAYRHTISTTVVENNGEYDDMEIKIRIPIRR